MAAVVDDPITSPASGDVARFHPGQRTVPGALQLTKTKPAGDGSQLEITATPVELKADEEAAFIAWICSELDQACERRDKRVKQYKVSVAQFRGRMKRRDKAPRSPDLDFSHSRELALRLVSAIMVPILAHNRLWTGDPKKARFRTFARMLERFMEQKIPKKMFKPQAILSLIHLCVYGSCWVRLVWEKKTTMERQWVPKPTPKEVDVGGVKTTITVDTLVEEAVERITFEGCQPAIVHPSRMLYPDDSGGDPQTSPWIAEEYEERLSEVRRNVETGVYRKKLAYKKLNDIEWGQTDKDVRSSYIESTDLEDDNKEALGTNPRVTLTTVYVPHPATGVETILRVDRESRQIIFWYENWLHEDPRPYRVMHFFETFEKLEGESLMMALENLHKAYTATFLIELDAAARANEKALFINEDVNPQLRAQVGDRLFPGIFFTRGGMEKPLEESIMPLAVGESPSSLAPLRAQIQQHMYSLSSIAGSINTATELAQRPTVGGTDRILSETQQPLSLFLERFLDFWSDIGMTTVGRYRQFYPTGWDFWAGDGDQDEMEFPQVMLQWPDGWWREQAGVRLRISSQQLSREIRVQELLHLLEQWPVMSQQLLQLASQTDPMNPMSQLAANVVLVYIKMIEQLLDELGIVDQAGNFDEESFKAIKEGQQSAQIIQQLLQAKAQLEAQLGIGQAGVSVPSGAPGAAGPPQPGPPPGATAAP